MIKCKEGFVLADEIVLSGKWIEENDDATIMASVRMMAGLSKHPYLNETHCGGIRNFDSIEEFVTAYEDSK